MNSGFRALVVDDDDLSREVMAAILRRLGAAEVAEASSGAAALAWADDAGGNVDLIVCDLRMPQLDGIETLDGLALRTYPAMVVIASGADSRVLRAAASTAGRHGLDNLRVIRKPVTIDKMREVVADMNGVKPQVEPTVEALTVMPPDCSTKMVRGLAHGEFVPFFQPKLQVSSRRVCGAEVHLRWNSDTYGLLTPDSFIGVAQSIGLLGDLFFAILPATIMACADWRRAGADFGISINLPVPLLGARDLATRLEDLVTTYGLEPHHVTLEVNEDAWLQDQGIGSDMLTRLRVRNFGLAIDDFGTGFATIKQLLDAPFNEMKIAQTFVHAAPDDLEAAIAMGSCIGLGRQLEMTVVAEGVENAAQWDHAAEAGCDQVQGEGVAPPMSASRFEQWLEEHKATLSTITSAAA